MTKDVVYTAVFDDYDMLLQPEEAPEQVDFLCFTDDPKKATGEWEPFVVEDSRLPPDMLNRKYKILPHEFLKDYRYSIYIDANIQITGDVCKLFTQHLNDEPLAVAKHPRRDCIYEEAEACVKKNLANKDVVNQQMSRYRSEGFPEKYGLTENRVLIRDHHNPQVISAMEEWWKELNDGARRDQLSFQYILWKTGLNPEELSENYKEQKGILYKQCHKPTELRNTKLGSVYEKKYQLENEQGQSRFIYIIVLLLYYIGRSVKIVKTEGITELFHRMTKRL